MPPRGPLPNPLGALWGPPKLGGPVTLSRVLPPVGGPGAMSPTRQKRQPLSVKETVAPRGFSGVENERWNE